jgi:hypothetical protein
MIERGQYFCFALETCQPIRIPRDRRGQDLEGDISLQLDVSRPVDLAHSAFAQLVEDPVRAEAGARAQRHPRTPVSCMWGASL